MNGPRPTHPCRVDLEDNRYWHDSWAGLVAIDLTTGEVIPDCFMADERAQTWAAYERGPDGKVMYTMIGGKIHRAVRRGHGPVKIIFPWERAPLDPRLLPTKKQIVLG